MPNEARATDDAVKAVPLVHSELVVAAAVAAAVAEHWPSAVADVVVAVAAAFFAVAEFERLAVTTLHSSALAVPVPVVGSDAWDEWAWWYMVEGSLGACPQIVASD